MNWKQDFTLTAKERENLDAWEEWGNKMKMLRAIHKEIAPKLAAMRGNWSLNIWVGGLNTPPLLLSYKRGGDKDSKISYAGAGLTCAFAGGAATTQYNFLSRRREVGVAE